MDLIKLMPLTGSTIDTDLDQGEYISGWDKCTWVEKFQHPGEFKIEAPLSSGLMGFLPVGTFVSHINTMEVMMVENQHIKQPKDADPRITITGRSFSAFMEHRIIHDFTVFGGSPNTVQEYALNTGDTGQQLVNITRSHLFSTVAANDDNSLEQADATTDDLGVTSDARSFKVGTVWERIYELMKVDNFGVKTERPSFGQSLLRIWYYLGGDVSNKVRFSWIAGDLDELEYFISNKDLKTHALVQGKWVQAFIGMPANPIDYDRRIMRVDASDLDQQLSAMPSGGALTDIVNKMLIRGGEALLKQQGKTITQVDVSPNCQWRYRTDYNLGDLVGVDGDFGISANMQVIEFAEIQDENGTTGHPTLALPGES